MPSVLCRPISRYVMLCNALDYTWQQQDKGEEQELRDSSSDNSFWLHSAIPDAILSPNLYQV